MNQFSRIFLLIMLLIIPTGFAYAVVSNDSQLKESMPLKTSIEKITHQVPAQQLFELTSEEKLWLQAHPIIRVGVTRDFPPYEWIDEHNRYVGPVAEYMGLIEKKLGVKFDIVHDRPWTDILDMAKRGELDMLSCVNKTPERSKFLNFTEPYKSTHIVMIDNGQGDYIDSLNQLNNKRVSVEKDYFMQEFMQNNHPNIQVVPAADTLKALDLVVSGAVDAYVGDAGTANYFIRKGALFSLRFTGQTEYDSQYRIAINQSTPLLTSIVEKTMKSISKEESETIFNRWLGLKIEQGIKTETLFKYAALLVGVLLLFGYWFIRLHKEIAKRKKSEQDLANNIYHFKIILDNLFTYVALLDVKGVVLEVNHAPLFRGGYRREDVIGKYFVDAQWWSYDVQVRSRLLKAIEAANQGQSSRYDEIVKMGNEFIYIDFQLSPIFNSDGKITGLLPSAVDITERKIMEEKLGMSEELYRFVLEGSELGFWDWNITTGKVERNARWANMLGYSYEEILHTTQQWTDFIYPDNRESAWQSINAVLEGESSIHRAEYRMLHKDGSIRWILDQAKIMQRDENGKPIRMSGTHSDITERKNLELELQRQAHIDYLTGANNRRHFMELAETELYRAKRYNKPLSLFMMDIDFFKHINDAHGHKIGDHVLM